MDQRNCDYGSSTVKARCIIQVGEHTVGLRELRQERALSQRDLADAAGVSKTTIVNIEAGRYQPIPSTTRKLAKALGIDPRELVQHLRSTSPRD
jgi:DNA-binding XRE family transcriptional regulator